MWVFFCSSPNGINLCLLYIPYIGKKKPTNTICKLAKLRVVFVGGESNSALCLVNFGYLKNVILWLFAVTARKKVTKKKFCKNRKNNTLYIGSGFSVATKNQNR